jgi:hypothetical protein
MPSADVDVDAPARFYMDRDGDGAMCLWLDYGPEDQFPVCLLREHGVPPEVWDAAVRQLVVDEVAVERVAIAIHGALDAIVPDGPPFSRLRDIRLLQAYAAIAAFGGVIPKGE